MTRDVRVVYWTTDGDLRKARDPEIQGDHRDAVVEILKAEGYTAVLAAG